MKLILIGVLGALTTWAVIGAELSDAEVLKRLSTDQPRDKAVLRGLEYLRKQQKPDGSTSERYSMALTAMSVMAHFAAGHPPADKQYGPWLRKSINYVLSKQNPDGYFGESDTKLPSSKCIMAATSERRCASSRQPRSRTIRPST